MYSNSSRARCRFLFTLKLLRWESFFKTCGIRNVYSSCFNDLLRTYCRNFWTAIRWWSECWCQWMTGCDSSSRLIFLKRISISLGPSEISRAYVRVSLLFNSKTSIWSRYFSSSTIRFISLFFMTHLSYITTNSSIISVSFCSKKAFIRPTSSKNNVSHSSIFYSDATFSGPGLTERCASCSFWIFGNKLVISSCLSKNSVMSILWECRCGRVGFVLESKLSELGTLFAPEFACSIDWTSTFFPNLAKGLSSAAVLL